MQRIPMNHPIVEMDGDEMTRIIWRMIKDELLLPFVELNTEYYDLGLPNRDKTDDEVTKEAAEANKRLGIAVKCATITANAQRMEEYTLQRLYPSPNATIRAMLDGTVFRAPICVDSISAIIPTWEKPITIARHAYGDVYKPVEYHVSGEGQVHLTMAEQGVEESKLVHHYDKNGGVAMAMHNTTSSIQNFARTCFDYALDTKQDLWFATKDTILKSYDGHFKEVFETMFESEYKNRFEEAGIEYMYTLIDDAVARVMRSSGGFIWACKNYDGDVMSDMVATVFGSLAMMTSVLVSPEGHYEFEAAHGTVTRHYYRHLQGEKTSTNPMATIYAWTGALKLAGKREDNAQLSTFAQNLEQASLDVIEDGIMTGDLLAMCALENKKTVTTEQFIAAIREKLEMIYQGE